MTTINISTGLLQAIVKASQRYHEIPRSDIHNGSDAESGRSTQPFTSNTRSHETAQQSDDLAVNAEETQVDLIELISSLTDDEYGEVLALHWYGECDGSLDLMRVRSYGITERPASNLAEACLHRTLPAALIRLMSQD
ncbi:MAG: hypothetical protein IPF79_09065 [Ignavibacteria bacterium]|nr:hypothetical protein [Ignavibacteria bacterium]